MNQVSTGFKEFLSPSHPAVFIPQLLQLRFCRKYLRLKLLLILPILNLKLSVPAATAVKMLIKFQPPSELNTNRPELLLRLKPNVHKAKTAKSLWESCAQKFINLKKKSNPLNSVLNAQPNWARATARKKSEHTIIRKTASPITASINHGTI